MVELCDEKCKYAMGPKSDCKCECDGKNHGNLHRGEPLRYQSPRFYEIGRELDTIDAKKEKLNAEAKQVKPLSPRFIQIGRELDALDAKKAKLNRELKKKHGYRGVAQ